MKKISVVWPLLAVIVVLAIPTAAAVVWMVGIAGAAAVSVLGWRTVALAAGVAAMTLVGIVTTLRWFARVLRRNFSRLLYLAGEIFCGVVWAAVALGFLGSAVLTGHLFWRLVSWSPLGWLLGDPFPATSAGWWVFFTLTGWGGMAAAMLAIAGGAVAFVLLIRGGFALWDNRRAIRRVWWWAKVWARWAALHLRHHLSVAGRRIRGAWESGFLVAALLIVLLIVLLVVFQEYQEYIEEGRSEVVVARAVTSYTVPTALLISPPELPRITAAEPSPAPAEESVFSLPDWLETKSPPRELVSHSGEVRLYGTPYDWYDSQWDFAARWGHTGAFPYYVPAHCAADFRGFELYNSFYPLGDGEDLMNGHKVFTIWQSWVCVWGEVPTPEQVQEVLAENGLEDPRFLQADSFLFLPPPVPAWLDQASKG